MTPALNLESLKALCEAATPGPWTAVDDGRKGEPMWSVKAARIAGKPPKHEVAICATGDSPQEMETANAAFIAAAREALPALIERCERAEREGDEASNNESTLNVLRATASELAKAQAERDYNKEGWDAASKALVSLNAERDALREALEIERVTHKTLVDLYTVKPPPSGMLVNSDALRKEGGQ